MRNQIGKTGEAINRIGGKIYSRLISIVPLGFAYAGAHGAWSGFADGPIWFGLLAGAFTLGCLWMVKKLWSPDRRLSEIDD